MASAASSELAPEPQQGEDGRPADDTERYLTNLGQIAAVLRRLKEERSLLTVRLAQRRLECRSVLLGVDTAARRLVLDELNPVRGHELVSAGTPLRVICAAHGVETRFDTEVLELGTDNGIHFYVTRLPTEVYYHQRRRQVRVPVRRTLQETVEIHDPDTEQTQRATLVDLSEGGIGGYVARDAGLTPGRAYRFRIKLRGHDEFRGELELRWEQEEKVHRRRLFGAQFHRMEPRERQRLTRLVAALQRELLRKT